jgi:hypothetical protein
MLVCLLLLFGVELFILNGVTDSDYNLFEISGFELHLLLIDDL